MADFTDVANAFVASIVGMVYPNGTAQPSIAPGAAPVKTYQGWPLPAQLDADLKAGTIHISVWPTPTERRMADRIPEWQPASVTAPTITLTVDTNTVTVGGSGAAGQNAALLVDGKSYVYAVQPTDISTSIATALANLVNADRPASSVGAVISIPNPRSIVARVGTQGTSIRELRRVEKMFQISIWAGAPDKRDPLAGKVDAALSALFRINLPDGTQGIVRYRSSAQDDGKQKVGIYRRDLLYAVEYSVTETRTDTQIVAEQTSISAMPQDGSTPIGQITINT